MCWVKFLAISVRIVFFLSVLFGALPAMASVAVERFTLTNGLEVVAIPNHRVPAVSHMIWYRVGAGDDPPAKSGLAHYHEHLMFQGTAKYKSGEYADIINRHGGQNNAFTGYDATSYFVNIAKEKLPLIMELEADRMRGLSPRDTDVEKEKDVIIEERRVRIENNPRSLLNEQMYAALFRNHPYHRPVIGWMHEMETLTKDDVLQFHTAHYHPNNAILIVSGDITAAELKPLAQRYYGGLPRADIPVRVWNEEPPQNTARRVVMRHMNVKQPAFLRYYATSSLAHGRKEDALPLFVLAHLLGGGKTSALYQSLVVEKKLAAEVSVDYEGFTRGPGLFSIEIIPESGVTLADIDVALDKELARIQSSAPDDAALMRAKTLLKADTIFARDGLDSMARIMGWIVVLGLDVDYFNRWPDMVEAVSKEQVQAAMKSSLSSDHSVTGWLLPEEKP